MDGPFRARFLLSVEAEQRGLEDVAEGWRGLVFLEVERRERAADGGERFHVIGPLREGREDAPGNGEEFGFDCGEVLKAWGADGPVDGSAGNDDEVQHVFLGLVELGLLRGTAGEGQFFGQFGLAAVACQCQKAVA